MDDLLDLFGDRKRATETKCDQVAPVELMSQFLILISERKMEEALALTNEILVYEPNNQMILEYKRSLAVYIQQAEGTITHAYFSISRHMPLTTVQHCSSR